MSQVGKSRRKVLSDTDSPGAVSRQGPNKTRSSKPKKPRKRFTAPAALRPQRTQYPLIKEYTLNHNIKAPIILKYVPQLRGIGISGSPPAWRNIFPFNIALAFASSSWDSKLGSGASKAFREEALHFRGLLGGVLEGFGEFVGASSFCLRVSLR